MNALSESTFGRIQIWLCDCGRVHIETRYYRQSFTPAEFLIHLRREAGRAGARVIPPHQPAYPTEACEVTTNSRAPHSYAVFATIF